MKKAPKKDKAKEEFLKFTEEMSEIRKELKKLAEGYKKELKREGGNKKNYEV